VKKPCTAYLNGEPLRDRQDRIRRFATVTAAKAAVADHCWDHKITLYTLRIEIDRKTP
jgi:hypothetical protein